ncbi:DUF7344 domain-containing protein [Haladaptatus halobius]|uniref:DUF7344 domain-containing protein n=1 Tax=Haladaptatus halobius TaxID=2884875 RepID=UPI003F61D5A9
MQTVDSTTILLAELAAVLQTRVAEVESVKQAQITLRHQHLPKLADHGIIEYDQWSETVR